MLAHLYWPRNEGHFNASRRAHHAGEGWPLKATPFHGVSRPERPTINFFVVDEDWVTGYERTAASRGVAHGIVVRRLAIERCAQPPAYEFVEVTVAHPHGKGVTDPREFWKYDIGNHRFSALQDMRSSTVARFATPEKDEARRIVVPGDAIVFYW